MQRPIRAVLISVASFALAGCGGGSQPTATGANTAATPPASVPAVSTSVAGASRFARDAGDLTSALRDYSATISSVSSASQFPEKSGALRGSAEAFRRALVRMNDYHLSDPTLETRRARIVAKGEGVAAVMRRLVDQAPTGDTASVAQSVAEFRTASDDFITGIQP